MSFIFNPNLAIFVAVTKSGTGTRGREEAGTWGGGDAGTSELGDARGFEDVGDKQIAPHFCAELVKNFF